MTDATAPATDVRPARRNNPLRAILFLCGGVFSFSLHDIAVKWMSGDYPLSEVLFIRSIVALPFMLLFVQLEAGLAALATPRLGVLLLRGGVLLVGYLAYYMGFAAIPFADAVALYMSVPLIIVALAGPFLGERVGLMRWLAVVVGFSGVVVMLRPGAGVLEPAALLILTCAFLYSVGMIMGRRLGIDVPASVMAFYTMLLFMVVAAALGTLFTVLDVPPVGHRSVDFMLRPFVVPTMNDLLVMTSCGLTAAIGVAGLTFAYREADANLVASFEYTALLWAVVWGFVVWGEVPGPATLGGAALIIGAGLVALAAGRRRRA